MLQKLCFFFDLINIIHYLTNMLNISYFTFLNIMYTFVCESMTISLKSVTPNCENVPFIVFKNDLRVISVRFIFKNVLFGKYAYYLIRKYFSVYFDLLISKSYIRHMICIYIQHNIHMLYTCVYQT